MAINPEIRDQAYQFFCQEATEFLHTIEEGLLTLRNDRSTANVHRIMRAAHSIKGGAASVELEGIKKIAHKLEDVFRALYNWEGEIDRDMEELLLHAFDALRTPLMAQIQTGTYNEADALAHAQPIFETLEALLGESLHQVDKALPTAAELGVDIAAVVFSGDVQQGIEHLESVLQDPQAEVVGEFRAEAEVFAGIGELLNLPGFTAIARAVLAAINQHPQHIREIAPIAIANFRAAQAQVLAGDRQEGGKPSPDLLRWTESPAALQTEKKDRLLPSEELNFDSWLEEDFTLPIEPMEDNLVADLGEWLTEEEESTVLQDLTEITSDIEDWLPEGGEEEEVTIIQVASTSSDAENWLTEEKARTAPIARREPAPQIEPQRAEKTAPDRTPAQMTEVIRVDLQRLERLNNLVGELVTAENGTELQLQQLQSAIKQLQERFTIFERLNRNLQTWLDQSQKIQVRNALRTQDQEFDPLQMDYYSPLYTMIQESIEEIAQMGEKVQDITLVAQEARNIQRKKQQTLRQLRNDLLWARMLPLGDILNRFPRMVRDLSLKYQKAVSCRVVGANTLVDKQMLEKLYDPLVHLVRNAFDHGIENSPAERASLGKAEEGMIEIRAYHQGNQTFIVVQDDGRGIDPQKVVSKAIEKGIITPDQAQSLSQQQIYELLFAPGFSTADKVTDLSGRGMGMDAVLSQVQALKGSITIESEVGKGTVFTLRFPLTLTISKLLIARVQGRPLAVPVDSLVSVISTDRSAIETIWGKEFYRYDRILVPIYPSHFLGSHYPLPAVVSKVQAGLDLPEDTVPLLLIALGNRTIALLAEQIITEQELVIKPFSPLIPHPSYFYGCTILGDGSLVPVLDTAALISQWLETQGSAPAVTPVTVPTVSFAVGESHRAAVPTILVVDDSLTARQTLALTLERAGYEVVQAGDGQEALDKLKKHNIKAVFCDVEMPVMNGFEFLTNCRKEYSADRLPVIMLTSRAGERHRGIAKLLGANHYLTKPFLEGDLLQTLQNCLSQTALVST